MEHTNKRYGQELLEVRTKLIEMGALVVGLIERAARCFAEHDVAGAHAIIEHDISVNRMDIEIEEECIRLLALHQPAASDLRLITAAIKITTELERIGDRVVNMCEAVAEPDALDSIPSNPEVMMLSALARTMVAEALEAFSRTDSAIVRRVMESDREFDALFSRVFPRLLASLSEPDRVGRDARLVLFSKDLNEISEHATNIAEVVMFLVDGKEIAHMDMHERRSSQRG